MYVVAVLTNYNNLLCINSEQDSTEKHPNYT